MTRKLASIRKIEEVREIANADNLSLYIIGGWEVVGKKGELKAGDLAVYFEIDSWIPAEIAPFLCRSTRRYYNDIEGSRLRTIKLRGQMSQGLVLPISDIKAINGMLFEEGEDLTEYLGIQLWERPISQALQGTAKGNFPRFWIKTDQERCQNIKTDIIRHYIADTEFEVTLKLDGSSMSIGMHEGGVTLASRNIELKLDADNAFANTFREANIEYLLVGMGVENLQISGELIGPGIQGNPHKRSKVEFYVYDIRRQGVFLSAEERLKIVNILGLKHVPIIKTATLFNMGISEPSKAIPLLLEAADATGLEGLVFKSTDGSFSFKAISNKYLLKES